MEPSGGVDGGAVQDDRRRPGRPVRDVPHRAERCRTGPDAPDLRPARLPRADSGEQWTRLRLREVSGMRARFSPSTMTAPSAVTVERTERQAPDLRRAHVRGTRSTDSIEYTRQQP